jgi:poly-gamma-glutamate synthesis protein (capsule biosynthesis protein)
MLTRGGIETVNLANNHAFDYKERGYNDTKAALAAEGIGYYGGGEILYQERSGIRVAFVGYDLFGRDLI